MFRNNITDNGGVICDFCQAYYPNKRCLLIHQYIHDDQNIHSLLSKSGLSRNSNRLPVAHRLLSPGIPGLRRINSNNVLPKTQGGRRMSEAVDEVLFLCQKYPLKTSHSRFEEKHSKSYNSFDKTENSSSTLNSAIENLDAFQFRNVDNNSSNISLQKEDRFDGRQAISPTQPLGKSDKFEEADSEYHGMNIRRKKSSDSAYGSSMSDGQCSSDDSSPSKSSSESGSNCLDLITNFELKSKNTCRNLTFKSVPRSMSPSVSKHNSSRGAWNSSGRNSGPKGLKYKSCNNNLDIMHQNKSVLSKLKMDEGFHDDGQELVGRIKPLCRLRN